VELCEIEESLVVGGGAVTVGGEENAQLAGSLIAGLIEQRGHFRDDLHHRFGVGERAGLMIDDGMLRLALELMLERLKQIAVRANEQVARAGSGNRSRKIGIAPCGDGAGLVAQAVERGIIAPEDVGFAGAGSIIAVEPGIDRFGRGVEAGLEKSRYGRIGGRILEIRLKIRECNGAGKGRHLLGK